MNKKLVILLTALSLLVLAFVFQSFTSNFLVAGKSTTTYIFLPFLVLLLAFLFLPLTKKTSDYRQRSAELLAMLFDEDPETIRNYQARHISETPNYREFVRIASSKSMPKEGASSYYSPQTGEIYYNPRKGYGEWVHEFTHAVRFKKGLALDSGRHTHQVDDIIARLVEEVSSDYSYRSFSKGMEKNIEVYKILDSELKEIYRSRLGYTIIAHSLASLYRRGRLSFEELKKLCHTPSSALVDESLKILSRNENYIPLSSKKALEKLNLVK